MSASMSLGTAAANGDLPLVERLLNSGADVNERSRDGMTPLCIAAFWGYADIVQTLLKHDAKIDSQNSGTLWTAIHCAAFQGHGKVILRLMEYKPDLTIKDSQGRTAADFASALDSIWSFFAAAGCKRTSKADLIKLKIVRKVTTEDPSVSQSDLAHFSRPGSSYAMRTQPLHGQRGDWDQDKEVASMTGDVLASLPEEPMDFNRDSPSITIWNN